MSNAPQNSTPPIDWQPVRPLDGVYEIRRSNGPVSLRAVAVELGSGSVCVYSPVPHAGQSALQFLSSLGAPLLLAPNAFHTLGLPEHAAAFADAKVVASDRASGRIRKKTGLPVHDLNTLRARLPAHVALLELPPIRNGEVWLSVRSANTCAWIVCDGFVNLQRTPPGALGMLLKLFRLAPGLSISATFKWMLKDHAAYRNWLLAQIERDKPTVLIPSHGQIINDPNLPTRLADLVRARL
jgi:hypothetical protein